MSALEPARGAGPKRSQIDLLPIAPHRAPGLTAEISGLWSRPRSYPRYRIEVPPIPLMRAESDLSRNSISPADPCIHSTGHGKYPATPPPFYGGGMGGLFCFASPFTDRTLAKHTRPGNLVFRIPAKKFRELEVVHPVFTTILLQLNDLVV